jgi:dephospho-CoA kinase
VLRVALTGGIATGKSRVLARLAELGAPTLDADALAHQAVAPGAPALAAIVARFGPAMLTPEGALDRRRLAALVFSDPKARADLEAIVHPEVYRRIGEWFAALEGDGSAAFGVVDVPLLYETGHDGDFDVVAATVCSPEVQVRRVMRRDGLTEEEAGRRLHAQQPAAEKARRADFAIDTGGAYEETDRQVEALYRALLDRAARARATAPRRRSDG